MQWWRWRRDPAGSRMDRINQQLEEFARQLEELHRDVDSLGVWIMTATANADAPEEVSEEEEVPLDPREDSPCTVCEEAGIAPEASDRERSKAPLIDRDSWFQDRLIDRFTLHPHVVSAVSPLTFEERQVCRAVGKFYDGRKKVPRFLWCPICHAPQQWAGSPFHPTGWTLACGHGVYRYMHLCWEGEHSGEAWCWIPRAVVDVLLDESRWGYTPGIPEESIIPEWRPSPTWDPVRHVAWIAWEDHVRDMVWVLEDAPQIDGIARRGRP